VETHVADATHVMTAAKRPAAIIHVYNGGLMGATFVDAVLMEQSLILWTSALG